MKGYRFYEEFDSSYKKRKRVGTGNVLALDIDPKTGRPYGRVEMTFPNGTSGPERGSRYVMECTASVFTHPNSGVAGCSVSSDVLSRNYRRITEAKAREIHPAMFAFLDQFDESGELKC